MSSAQSLNNRKSSESQQMTRPKMPLTLARTLSFESGAARCVRTRGRWKAGLAIGVDFAPDAAPRRAAGKTPSGRLRLLNEIQNGAG